MFRLGSKSKVTRKMIGISLLSLTTSVFALPLDNLYKYQPYIGFDAYQRKLNMVPGFGQGMFQARVPQYNLYVGAQFNEYFGVEGGQTSTEDVVRTTPMRQESCRL